MNTAIIILNWNGSKDTIGCLDSILAHLDTDDFLFVTDNGSIDNSVNDIHNYFLSVDQSVCICESEKLKEVFKPTQRIYIVKNTENLGFGAGNNSVLKQLPFLDTHFQWAWLLNSDTFVTSTTLSSLKLGIKRNDQIAVIGSLILNYPDVHTIQCSGVKHYKFFGVSKLINKNKPYNKINLETQVSFDYLNGASLLFKIEPLGQVGYFDEDFFLYSEEYDLQLRLQKKGYELCFEPRSIVYHKLSEGTKNRKQMFYYYYNTSAVILSRKHFQLIFTFFGVFNLLAITFIRTFPSFNNFKSGLRGILDGLKKTIK